MSDKLTNVRVEYENSVTVNTGNFQNVRPGYRVSADVPEGMHPNEARARLQSVVDRWLEEDVERIHAEMSQ